jgi:hypothetical protein
MNEMQPNGLGAEFLVKMAPDCVAELGVQFLQSVSFCEDGLTERTRRVSALRRFFDKKNDLFHMLFLDAIVSRNGV